MGATAGSRRYAKPCIVAERLDLLTGPTGGSVRLPGHLAWSGSRQYDLDAPGRIIDLYRTVLIEAASPADLYAYLDEATLKRLWSYLWLPSALRTAWEERFPQLAELSRLATAPG
jgi:hypothetical protein